MENEKKTTLGGVIDAAMDKVRAMADANTIVGQPIQTADGVTLIPISKVSMGFGGGGTDYGSAQTKDLSGGLGGGVKIDWEDINLQDIVEEARAELYRAQAEEIRRRHQAE